MSAWIVTNPHSNLANSLHSKLNIFHEICYLNWNTVTGKLKDPYLGYLKVPLNHNFNSTYSIHHPSILYYYRPILLLLLFLLSSSSSSFSAPTPSPPLLHLHLFSTLIHFTSSCYPPCSKFLLPTIFTHYSFPKYRN